MSLVFDGVQNYVLVPASALIDLTGPLTLAAWLKLANLTNLRGVLSTRTGSNGYDFYVRNDKGGLLNLFTANGAGTDNLFSNLAVADEKWHHVAVTRDAAGSTIFYVDGVADVPQAASFGIAAGGALSIGRSELGANYFGGNLADARLYDQALSAAQVASLARGGGPLIPSLVGWWPLDEGAGTIAHDRSGNADNGALTGSPLPAWGGWVPGDGIPIPLTRPPRNVRAIGRYQ